MLMLVDWKRVAAVTAIAVLGLAALPQIAGSFALHVLTVSLYYTILAAS